AAVGGVDAEGAALAQDGGGRAHDLGQRRLHPLRPGVAVLIALVGFGKCATKLDSQREVSLLDIGLVGHRSIISTRRRRLSRLDPRARTGTLAFPDGRERVRHAPRLSGARDHRFEPARRGRHPGPGAAAGPAAQDGRPAGRPARARGRRTRGSPGQTAARDGGGTAPGRLAAPGPRHARLLLAGSRPTIGAGSGLLHRLPAPGMQRGLRRPRARVHLPVPWLVVRPRGATAVGPVAARPRRAGGHRRGGRPDGADPPVPHRPRQQRADRMTASPPPGPRPWAWVDERLGLSALRAALLRGEMPGGASFWHALGAAAAGLFAVEALTGLCLSLFYAPSVQTAWASVAYVQDQLPFGWFVRGLHGFGASALVAVAGLHLLQVLLFGAYRKPREANWIVGLGLFGLTVLFALSGALLPHDQKGYWAKQVEAAVVGRLPLVGGPLQRLLQGGDAFGNLTLTHAFAIHALALPAAFLALLGLHVFLYRRHGPTPGWWLSARQLADRQAPLWPDQTARDAAAAALALAVVALATFVRHGPALEAPADPSSSYLARPDWYALPLYQLRTLFEGSTEILATLIIPGIASALLVAVPFLDRGPSRRPADRRRVL